MPDFPQGWSHHMKAVAAVVATAALLAGCSLPTLFRVPILQGNIVDSEKVKQLEPGMTPRQVRYLLGTPLIDNSFDARRWDYVFYLRDKNANVSESQLSLFFDDGKLARIEGDKTYQAMLPEEMREIDPDELEEAMADDDSPLPAERRPTPEPGPDTPSPVPGG